MKKISIPALLIANRDILITLLILMVIMMMIIPIPAILMDFLLSVNIALSIIIFLISLYTLRQLDFSIFPSMLLVATLFRLSLNISTTRLILLNGFAGRVIESFGNFVIGGNYIVGFVIFLILIVVNFMVITQGANRVAEVAARFTLDAMPGKQMAIDADLNAGILTDEEAKIARRDISRQADFYGAMDGASKFVKGDAIAGILIVVINLIGGFAVGMLQQKLTLLEALKKYALLTVGDGIVTQIPALLISVATGMIVTRATSDSNLGEQISVQFLSQPRALGIGGAIVFLMGFLPGLPKPAFFIIGIGLVTVAYTQYRRIKRDSARKKEVDDEIAVNEMAAADDYEEILKIDDIEIELGYELVSIVESGEQGNLSLRIDLIRKQIISETGFIVPPIRIRDNMQLPDNHYVIKIKGVDIVENDLFINDFLILNPENTGFEIDGKDTIEPVFNLPARWINAKSKQLADIKGYTVIDPVSLLVTHLTEIIKEYASDLLGLQDVQKLLDRLSNTNPVVVKEVIPNLISLSDLTLILKNLLKERIPIKNLATILETISSRAKMTKNIELLTEYVRQGLARSITKMYENPPGVLSVIVIDPEIEQRIMDSLQQTEHGIRCILDPEYVKNLMSKIEEESKKISIQGFVPVILCLASVRSQLKQISEPIKPKVIVLSYDEIIHDIRIEPIGMIRLREFSKAKT
jgi:flagellar biosynthesis protein FlhA